MLDTDDMALLREFVRTNSETAFAELVQRHLNLVYSVALRCTASPGDAQDVAQAVFIILARKAARLNDRTVLTGWLYETTRLTAAGWLRTQQRRQAREQEAYMQSTLDQADPDNLWRQLAPHLEAAMSRLNAKERTLLALRFYENKTGVEAAALLGIGEEAAHKRTARALEKLRKIFTKRGIVSTTTILAGAISTNSVSAAPVGLAVTISATAAKSAVISATVTTLIEETMKTMTRIKYKFAISFGVTTLLAVGATTIALSQAQPTVFSLLANPPIISNATFEREINLKALPPGFPASAQKQTFSFSLDGENYRMNFGGSMVGRFDDILWQTVGEQVTRFNLKWNTVNSVTNPATAEDAVPRIAKAARARVNNLLTFGIVTSNPENVAWDSTLKKFAFQDEYGGNKWVADFTQVDGLPVSATIRNSITGAADAIIVYRYSHQFFGGQLPSEFIRYAGNVVSENTKIEVVRIKSLQFSKQHLPLAQLDPDMFLHSTNANYMPVFYSNNIPYWTDAKGRVRKVLTVEENRKEIEKIKANQAKQ